MKRPNKDLLKRFNVHNTHDNEFQANAKLLQCWWRIYSFLPKGKYGYMLPLEEAKKKGYNFLTDNIRKHVKEEIENKEVSNKLIDGNRLYSHMLSSQAMTFNLFGELKSKLELATNVFNKLFNNKIKKVDNIEFEYSPGRRNIKYTGDRTAFDVFIEYTTLDDSKGFFGIEVKYSEDLKPFNNDALIKSIESYNKNKTRYHEITNESKIFKEEKFQQLTEFKIFQIWIKHLLALSLMQDYAEGFFIYLYPRNNEAYQNGLNDYQNLLISSDYDKNHLHPMHLETFVEALKSIDKSDWIKEFEFRYFRFHQLKFIKARQDVRYYKLAYELNNKFQKLLEKNEVFFNADKDHLYLISLKDTNLFREIECIDKVFEVPYDTFFSRLTNIKNLEIINEDNIKELVNILKVHEVESVTNDFLMKTELLRLKAWVIKNALINNNYLMFDKNIKYITTNNVKIRFTSISQCSLIAENS